MCDFRVLQGIKMEEVKVVQGQKVVPVTLVHKVLRDSLVSHVIL
jgi:hypothetical protein